MITCIPYNQIVDHIILKKTNKYAAFMVSRRHTEYNVFKITVRK